MSSLHIEGCKNHNCGGATESESPLQDSWSLSSKGFSAVSTLSDSESNSPSQASPRSSLLEGTSFSDSSIASFLVDALVGSPSSIIAARIERANEVVAPTVRQASVKPQQLLQEPVFAPQSLTRCQGLLSRRSHHTSERGLSSLVGGAVQQGPVSIQHLLQEPAFVVHPVTCKHGSVSLRSHQISEGGLGGLLGGDQNRCHNREFGDDAKLPFMSSFFSFCDISLAVPAGFEVLQESQSQVVLRGPFDEGFFAGIEERFADAGLRVVVEYWGGIARVRMPSGLPSEKNVVEEGRLYWQDRNPNERKDVITFGSSATFLFEGSVSSAGASRRLVPDASLSKSSTYFAKVGKEVPQRILANGYLPETVVEVRSSGNPRGELEGKAGVMLSAGTREFFLIDGIEGVTKSYRLLAPGETAADARAEEGPDRVVILQPLSEVVAEEDAGASVDLKGILVIVTDRNPGLLRSRVWEHLCFDVTPLKTDPVFWLPSVHLHQTTAAGLVLPLQRRIEGVDYALPAQCTNVVKPKYSLSDIEWTAKVRDKPFMAKRAIAAIGDDDMEAFELALVHINDINRRSTSGRLLMVEALRSGRIHIAHRLLDEGIDWLAEDSLGMRARDAVCVWARDDAGLVAAMADVASDHVRDLAAAVRFGSIAWYEGIVRSGVEPSLALKAATEAPSENFLQAALRAGIPKTEAMRFLLEWTVVMPRTVEEKSRTEKLFKTVLSFEGEVDSGDAGEKGATGVEAEIMAWAVKEARVEIVELLLARGVDPNAGFSPEESAMEIAVSNTEDIKAARRLVKILVTCGAPYDKCDIQRIITKKRRQDWFDKED